MCVIVILYCCDTHACMHTVTHSSIQLYTQTHVYSCTHTHTIRPTHSQAHAHALKCNLQMQARTHPRPHERTHPRPHARMHTYTLTRTHAHAHAHTHTHTHARTHTHTHTHSRTYLIPRQLTVTVTGELHGRHQMVQPISCPQDALRVTHSTSYSPYRTKQELTTRPTVCSSSRKWWERWR